MENNRKDLSNKNSFLVIIQLVILEKYIELWKVDLFSDFDCVAFKRFFCIANNLKIKKNVCKKY